MVMTRGVCAAFTLSECFFLEPQRNFIDLMPSNPSSPLKVTFIQNADCETHSTRLRIRHGMFLILLAASLGMLTLGQTQSTILPSAPTLSVAKILAFTKAFASNSEIQNMPDRIQQFAFDDCQLRRKDLVAFEEHRLFVYAVSESPQNPAGRKGVNRESGSTLSRRVIFLKPSIIVVDDEISGPPSGSVDWMLYSQNPPEISGHYSRFVDEGGKLSCMTLLPEKARLTTLGMSRGVDQTHHVGLRVETEKNSGRTRFLNVMIVDGQGIGPSQVHINLPENEGPLRLTISSEKHAFHLSLPPFKTGAGEIAIARSDGLFLLERRPFPSGILPYGPEGMRNLDSWDAAYRGENRPNWDAGRPSGELQRVVEKGIVRACRAVDLGCGSGTDAIYLASKGFEVTAIDIAPTALNQGKQKAEKAGVKVRWLLADVLAIPDLQPYNFIFDRGCYHEVRFEGAKAYVDTIRKLSQAGTQFLLLAGNPNELMQKYSPPQVTEEEIRADFSSLFDFEWIGETRFETSQPQNLGPLAWSVMMRRKR